MRTVKAILLFLVITVSVVAQGVNPNFDYSGVYKFYDIVNTLQRNQEPTNKEWNELFSTPGYKVLTSGEFTKEFFKKNFRLVFMPSKAKELQRNLERKNHLWHLNHYIKVRDHKDKITAQLKKLQNNPYNRKAITRTLKYLPQSYVNEYPPVAFLVFESNGRGSSPIVVDIAASIEWDFVSFLSHEFHHWYRNRQMKFNYANVKSEDIFIVEAFDHIEAEGIADMVDKRKWFTESSNSVSRYARQFINDVSRTPYVIKKMDALLIKAAKSSSAKQSIGRRMLKLLPQRGHTTGYFMASMILENLGKRKLVECVGNPFKFLQQYNRAAKLNGTYPAFSNDAMKIINQMASNYVSQ